jgi:integrase/recombinase XerD
MLELLYATGLRVSELIGLTLVELSLQEGLVRVIGKGSKERIVPLGEEARRWLERYLAQGRPVILAGRVADALFVTQRGAAMSRQMFWVLIKRYAIRAGITTRYRSLPMSVMWAVNRPFSIGCVYSMV